MAAAQRTCNRTAGVKSRVQAIISGHGPSPAVKEPMPGGHCAG